jgi:aspartate racemase
MKTIGLLAGMSWQSSLSYYTRLNQGISKQLGGLHSAKIAMVSVDFAPIEQKQHQGNWAALGQELASNAKSIEAAGADFLLICTNTMHKVAPQVENEINIPLLHIADATGEALLKKKITRVGLLGTKFTMLDDFYKGRLKQQFDIDVIVPQECDIAVVHDIIYQELCLGEIKQASKNQYLNIIGKLQQAGAQGVILGCTEIGLLVSQTDTNVSLFDTTELHIAKAIELAISN